MKKFGNEIENGASEELKNICLNRVPDLGKGYFLLTECIDGEVLIYSKGSSWGRDGEVRVPRAVIAHDYIEFYNNKGVRCYVIHTAEEFEFWARCWVGPALIKPDVWACPKLRF